MKNFMVLLSVLAAFLFSGLAYASPVNETLPVREGVARSNAITLPASFPVLVGPVNETLPVRVDLPVVKAPQKDFDQTVAEYMAGRAAYLASKTAHKAPVPPVTEKVVVIFVQPTCFRIVRHHSYDAKGRRVKFGKGVVDYKWACNVTPVGVGVFERKVKTEAPVTGTPAVPYGGGRR